MPLIFGGVSVALYGLIMALSFYHKNGAEMTKPTRSFSVKTALILAAVIAVVLVASAALSAWFGQAGLVVASAVAGLADVHASTISVASLAVAGKLTATNAVIPILIGFFG